MIDVVRWSRVEVRKDEDVMCCEVVSIESNSIIFAFNITVCVCDKLVVKDRNKYEFWQKLSYAFDYDGQLQQHWNLDPS